MLYDLRESSEVAGDPGASDGWFPKELHTAVSIANKVVQARVNFTIWTLPLKMS